MSVRVAAATATLSIALALAMAGSAHAAASDVLPTPPPAGPLLVAPGPAVGTTPPSAR